MVTRQLSGKHHRTNILHVFQRIGIVVIVVATKYNPNCTPSKISRKSELGNPKLVKSPQSLDAQMKAQPNPVTRSSPKELRKLLRQMIRFDELWRSLKRGGFIWKWTIHEYPKSILHWQFCWHFQTRVRCRLQTLSRMHSFQTISASGPREILHADFLGASDFVPRRMPLSSKSVHSATKEENMKNMTFEANRYQFRINVNPGLVNP